MSRPKLSVSVIRPEELIKSMREELVRLGARDSKDQSRQLSAKQSLEKLKELIAKTKGGLAAVNSEYFESLTPEQINDYLENLHKEQLQITEALKETRISYVQMIIAKCENIKIAEERGDKEEAVRQFQELEAYFAELKNLPSFEQHQADMEDFRSHVSALREIYNNSDKEPADVHGYRVAAVAVAKDLAANSGAVEAFVSEPLKEKPEQKSSAASSAVLAVQKFSGQVSDALVKKVSEIESGARRPEEMLAEKRKLAEAKKAQSDFQDLSVRSRDLSAVRGNYGAYLSDRSSKLSEYEKALDDYNKKAHRSFGKAVWHTLTRNKTFETQKEAAEKTLISAGQNLQSAMKSAENQDKAAMDALAKVGVTVRGDTKKIDDIDLSLPANKVKSDQRLRKIKADIAAQNSGQMVLLEALATRAVRFKEEAKESKDQVIALSSGEQKAEAPKEAAVSKEKQKLSRLERFKNYFTGDSSKTRKQTSDAAVGEIGGFVDKANSSEFIKLGKKSVSEKDVLAREKEKTFFASAVRAFERETIKASLVADGEVEEVDTSKTGKAIALFKLVGPQIPIPFASSAVGAATALVEVVHKKSRERKADKKSEFSENFDFTSEEVEGARGLLKEVVGEVFKSYSYENPEQGIESPLKGVDKDGIAVLTKKMVQRIFAAVATGEVDARGIDTPEGREVIKKAMVAAVHKSRDDGGVVGKLKAGKKSAEATKISESSPVYSQWSDTGLLDMVGIAVIMPDGRVKKYVHPSINQGAPNRYGFRLGTIGEVQRLGLELLDVEKKVEVEKKTEGDQVDPKVIAAIAAISSALRGVYNELDKVNPSAGDKSKDLPQDEREKIDEYNKGVVNLIFTLAFTKYADEMEKNNKAAKTYKERQQSKEKILSSLKISLAIILKRQFPDHKDLAIQDIINTVISAADEYLANEKSRSRAAEYLKTYPASGLIAGFDGVKSLTDIAKGLIKENSDALTEFAGSVLSGDLQGAIASLTENVAGKAIKKAEELAAEKKLQDKKVQVADKQGVAKRAANEIDSVIRNYFTSEYYKSAVVPTQQVDEMTALAIKIIESTLVKYAEEYRDAVGYKQESRRKVALVKADKNLDDNLSALIPKDYPLFKIVKDKIQTVAININELGDAAAVVESAMTKSLKLSLPQDFEVDPALSLLTIEKTVVQQMVERDSRTSSVASSKLDDEKEESVTSLPGSVMSISEDDDKEESVLREDSLSRQESKSSSSLLSEKSVDPKVQKAFDKLKSLLEKLAKEKQLTPDFSSGKKSPLEAVSAISMVYAKSKHGDPDDRKASKVLDSQLLGVVPKKSIMGSNFSDVRKAAKELAKVSGYDSAAIQALLEKERAVAIGKAKASEPGSSPKQPIAVAQVVATKGKERT